MVLGVASLVFTTFVLDVPLSLSVWAFALGGVVLESTLVVASNLRRLSHASGDEVAMRPDSHADVALLSDFRPRWFARVAIMIVGFSFGSFLALLGVVVLINGNGSRVVGAVVAMVGLMLLMGGVRSARRGHGSSICRSA
jgi:hypothetical protein